MSKISSKKILYYFYAPLIIILLFIAGFFLLYKFGYRLTNKFWIEKAGKIEIQTNKTGLGIYIDEKLMSTTQTENEKILFKNLAPQTYNVVISKNNFWPWIKNINIKSGLTTVIYPFLISKNQNFEKIKTSSEDFQTYSKFIIKNVLPTFSDKKISDNKNVAIWIEGTQIFAEWLGKENEIPYFFCVADPCVSKIIEIIKLNQSIKNLDFYGNREDVIMFSTNKNIYALEIDKRGTQNFQPIYTNGIDPFFYKKDTSTLYILENNSLIMIKI